MAQPIPAAALVIPKPAAPTIPIPPLPTPSILLMGAPGSGKTDSLVELITHGLELFVIITEPNGIDTLLDSCKRRNADINKLHWKQIAPHAGSFEDMLKSALTTSTLSFESITKLSGVKPARSQFVEFLTTLTDFQCERTGTHFGMVDKFDHKQALAIDSLSGVNLISMAHVIGSKPAAHVGEWGLAMGQIENLFNRLCSSLKCTFVLTAHLERETDELTQATKLMASTLGKKLAPKLPRFFSEVVMTYKEVGKFYWATDFSQVDLKHRALPMGSKLDPSFRPVIEAYHRRVQQVKPS